jgi:signal peptidase I
LDSYSSVENPEPVPQPAAHTSWLKLVLETLQTVVLALVLYVMIDSVVARVRVENISMLPTLQAGEFILVNKLAYKFSDVHRGDIVVFHFPQNPHEDYIKRVIGVPGDTVDIHDNEVWINNQQLAEAYIASEPQYSGTWQVPKDNLFVLGDNRNQSSDSHSWGFVPFANIVGKAQVIYWPFSEIKVLNQPFIVEAATGIK